MQRVCHKNGWCPEALHLALDSNLCFCEHTETTINVAGHAITTDQPVLIAAPPSTGKSGLMRLSEKLLLESSNAPEVLQADKLTLKEATTAGVRTLLYNYSRCRFVTDEVANSIGTPFSEKGPTVHYLSKALLCTWTQGEADHAVTAGGQIHLQSYRFQAKLGGQPRICEHLLKPSPQGFFKRPNFVFVSDRLVQPQPDLDAEASMQLLQGAHDFCLHHAWCEKQARPRDMSVSLSRQGALDP